MEKPLKTPDVITKGLTENQYKALNDNVNVLATSEDNKIKSSAWRTIKQILKYIRD